ncbi:MAG: hypothetical protein ACRC6V_05710 [Bacteroidales bacterium]
MNDKLTAALCVAGAENAIAAFIVADKVGIMWGFSDTPKKAGNTWDGVGKSMIGTVTVSTEDWMKLVWCREKGEVVQWSSLAPSGRMFSFDDVPDAHIAKLFLSKVTNARDRSIKFSYSFAGFAELIASKKCAITGRELTHQANSDDNSSQFSIDRLDPIIGYEPGNCIVMCGDANLAKADVDKFLNNPKLTDAEKLSMIYKVENVLRKRIKKKSAEEEAARAAEQHRKEAFGAKFSILPPALR